MIGNSTKKSPGKVLKIALIVRTKLLTIRAIISTFPGDFFVELPIIRHRIVSCVECCISLDQTRFNFSSAFDEKIPFTDEMPLFLMNNSNLLMKHSGP